MKNQHLTYSLHKLVFVLDKMADQALKEKIDLTFSQFKVLMAIDHQTVSQSDIARHWQMSDPAVSRQIELLVNKKLIEQDINQENRRQNQLKLTATGKKVLQKAEATIESKYEETFGSLTQKEKSSMAESIEKILSHLCPNQLAPGNPCSSSINKKES
jgi:DNA-binding MarR family transcriptional regulator